MHLLSTHHIRYYSRVPEHLEQIMLIAAIGRRAMYETLSPLKIWNDLPC